MDPTLTPEQWQQYLQNAMAALRLNHNDQGALAAIKQANQALNSFDQPAIAAGTHVSPAQPTAVGGDPRYPSTMDLGNSGDPLEGLKGLGQAVGDIPAGVGRLAKNLLTNPDQIFEDMASIPGNVAKGLASGDPRTIGRTVGNVGSMALPFAKTSGAAEAGTVGGLAARGATAPFRAIGDILQRPGLKNALLREQTARAAAQRGIAETTSNELMPERINQAGLRTQLLENQVERAPAQTQAALHRVELMLQQIERGGPTIENLGLRNQLLDLKIQLMQNMLEGGGEGGLGDALGGTAAPKLPPSPTAPAPSTAIPPNPLDALQTLSPEELAAQPLGKTPPAETSNAAPGVTENQSSVLARLALDREKFASHTPETILPEPIENLPGKMGQKTVQFGQSGLSPAVKSEILSLMPQIEQILRRPK